MSRRSFAFLLSPEASFNAVGLQGETLDTAAHFWQVLVHNPKYRVAYYNTLIEYLRVCVEKKKVLGVSLEQAIATLNFLAFIPYLLELPDPALPRDCQGIAKASSALDNDLNQVMSFGLKSVTKLLPELLQGIIVLPALSYTHRDQKFMSLLTGMEVQITSLAELVNPAGPGSYQFYLNPLFAEMDYGKHTFLLLYVRTILERHPHLRPLLGHTLLDFLQRLPEDDPAFEPKLLPLLYVLETQIMRFGATCLKELATEVDSFRRWPLPYSTAANQVFTLLQTEIQKPGLTFMQRLRASWSPLSLPHAPDTATEFILSSNSSPLGVLLAEWSNREFELYLKVPKLPGKSRTSVIAHLLRVNWIKLQLPKSGVQVQHLSEQDSLRVFELLLQGNETQAENIVLGTGLGDPELVKAYKISQLPGRACVEYPPLFLSRLDPDAVSFNATQLGESFKVISQDLRVGNIYRELQELLRPSEFPVKLMIIGSDELYHAFLLAYYKLVSADNDLYESVQLQVYIVPDLGKTDSLSQFVATVDPWYQRHVYIPARRLPWAPTLSPTDIESVHQKGTPLVPPELELPPVRMVASLLRHYLQEANTQLHIPLYELECVGFKTSFTLPFCMYVEVGITPAAKREQQRNSPDMSLESIIESRFFRFEPQPLHIKVTPVDLFGVEQPCEEMINRLVNRLVVSNIPRPSDRVTSASPLSGWLELALLDQAGAEEETNLMKRVKSGRQIPQEVVNLQSSLYTGLHVREVVVSAALPLSAFDVLVDGEVYGPFTSVKLMPMRPLASDDWPSLRVMTFMESDKV